MPKIRTISPVPKYQPAATLSQALPVQNTYYTVLETAGAIKLFSVTFAVADTGETLQARITIDGEVYGSALTQAAVAGTSYQVITATDSTGVYLLWSAAASGVFIMGAAPLECRSLKVEIRKTTATGNGTITGAVVYSKW